MISKGGRSFKLSSSKTISILALIFVFLGSAVFLLLSAMQVNQPQDIRGQAYEAYGGNSGGNTGGGTQTNTHNTSSCSEAEVNLQFRAYTGKETFWFSGENENGPFKPKAGDVIDVNCFSKTGTALLSQGVIKVTRVNNGETESIVTTTKPNLYQFTIPNKPGKYIFACSNPDQSCVSQDSFTIAEVAATPTPAPTATPAGCGVSDLDKNCVTDIRDWVLFLTDYRIESEKE
jgi:hypothetical protein